MSDRACEQTRQQLSDYVRNTLTPEEAQTLEAHVATCTQCAAALAEERTVNELLRTRLPVTKAPDSLQRAIAAQVARSLAESAASGRAAEQPSALAEAEPSLAQVHSIRTQAAGERGTSVTRRGWLIGSLGTASLAAAGLLGLMARGPAPATPTLSLPREALNDHRRVVYAADPIEIANGGLHQVKPWFTGRVDFAPDITFVGDDEYPMLGGAVGYFVDRKAATFVFKRRLHTISLFVFRSEGLEWPHAETQQVAGKQVQVSTLDGFHLTYWEAEGLGHVMVSDAGSDELLGLTNKLLK